MTAGHKTTTAGREACPVWALLARLQTGEGKYHNGSVARLKKNQQQTNILARQNPSCAPEEGNWIVVMDMCHVFSLAEMSPKTKVCVRPDTVQVISANWDLLKNKNKCILVRKYDYWDKNKYGNNYYWLYFMDFYFVLAPSLVLNLASIHLLNMYPPCTPLIGNITT